MKEFTIVVRCNSAEELINALHQAVADVINDPAVIDDLPVDGQLDCTAGEADEITLQRIS